MHHEQFTWADKLFPERLKSPWWIGHIPFAFELIGRMKPRTVVELGTYSGSSFAAFCQAIEATGSNGHVYGIDLWQGDVHMGSFEESLYQEMSAFVVNRYPDIATLIRKDFNEAVHSFADGSIDLLHIDGTHTEEAVRNDFTTWLPKLSERGVVLFHDVNVTVQNVGEAALKFGVRRVFESLKPLYPNAEFAHCFGLGVLVVGKKPDSEVLRLLSEASTPEAARFFAAKGALISHEFEALGLTPPSHGAYTESGNTDLPASTFDAGISSESAINEIGQLHPDQLSNTPSLLRRVYNKLRRLVAH